nr:hypothetical protein [Tanacetum cinerariifolium]
MAASAITISSDSSDESVGPPPSRVILFGDIPTVIPSTSVITPDTSAIALVISSAALIIKTTIVICFGDIPTVIPFTSVIAPETSTIAHVISSAAPVVETTIVASPTGLCGLDSDPSEASNSSEVPPLQYLYVTTVAYWRSRVTTRSSSPSDFPIAPVTSPPETRRRAAILIRLGEAIPLGRPYRTHHRPSSSSSPMNSLPVHSSGLDAPGQAHSGSSTQFVSPRLGYPQVRAPRNRSLAPTRADLLPPRKRFRDSYSLETSIEEDTDIDTTKTEDDRESVEDIPFDLDGSIRDFYHHMSKVRVDRIVGIDTTQRQLEAGHMIASKESWRKLRRLESFAERHLGFRP